MSKSIALRVTDNTRREIEKKCIVCLEEHTLPTELSNGDQLFFDSVGGVSIFTIKKIADVQSDYETPKFGSEASCIVELSHKHTFHTELLNKYGHPAGLINTTMFDTFLART